MNEEKLNISTRKFLKNVGVNSQRIIETSIRKAIESNKINSSKDIDVSISLKIEFCNLGTWLSKIMSLNISRAVENNE